MKLLVVFCVVDQQRAGCKVRPILLLVLLHLRHKGTHAKLVKIPKRAAQERWEADTKHQPDVTCHIATAQMQQRERQRQRDRETDRNRERERDRERDRETETDRQRQTDRQTDRQTARDRETERAPSFTWNAASRTTQ